MKELRNILRECKSDAEIIAFLAVVLIGVAAWVIFCIWAPAWIIRVIALPMGVVILNACGKVKAWMDKEEELRQMNEYEQACEQMRKEAAEMRKGE